MPLGPELVQVDDLHKTFPGPPPVAAVRGVHLRAHAGEVLGLLGANGAGKTTTLRLISTLLRPDRGQIRIAGVDAARDPEGLRAKIGYLSASTGLYPRLTPRELLGHFAALQGVAEPGPRVDALLERLGIAPFADRRCDQLSTGQKQRTSIARALVHEPQVLILDEPTLGLDVLVAQTVLEQVEAARAEGRCVLYSTHILSEVERLCDRVAIIHEGEIRACEAVDALKARTGARTLDAAFLAVVRGEVA